jgi:hypothetical protein
MQAHISIDKSDHFKLTQALLVYRSERNAFGTKHEVRYGTGEALCSPPQNCSGPLPSSAREGSQGSILPEIFPANILARTEQLLC